MLSNFPVARVLVNTLVSIQCTAWRSRRNSVSEVICAGRAATQPPCPLSAARSGWKCQECSGGSVLLCAHSLGLLKGRIRMHLWRASGWAVPCRRSIHKLGQDPARASPLGLGLGGSPKKIQHPDSASLQRNRVKVCLLLQQKSVLSNGCLEAL